MKNQSLKFNLEWNCPSSNARCICSSTSSDFQLFVGLIRGGLGLSIWWWNWPAGTIGLHSWVLETLILLRPDTGGSVKMARMFGVLGLGWLWTSDSRMTKKSFTRTLPGHPRMVMSGVAWSPGSCNTMQSGHCQNSVNRALDTKFVLDTFVLFGRNIKLLRKVQKVEVKDSWICQDSMARSRRGSRVRI